MNLENNLEEEFCALLEKLQALSLDYMPGDEGYVVFAQFAVEALKESRIKPDCLREAIKRITLGRCDITKFPSVPELVKLCVEIRREATPAVSDITRLQIFKEPAKQSGVKPLHLRVFDKHPKKDKLGFIFSYLKNGFPKKLEGFKLNRFKSWLEGGCLDELFFSCLESYYQAKNLTKNFAEEKEKFIDLITRPTEDEPSFKPRQNYSSRAEAFKSISSKFGTSYSGESPGLDELKDMIKSKLSD